MKAGAKSDEADKTDKINLVNVRPRFSSPVFRGEMSPLDKWLVRFQISSYDARHLRCSAE